MQNSLTKLKKSGFKSTKARQAVVSALAANKHSLSITEIHKQGRKILPSLNLVSVYRSLDLLIDLGLVEQHMHAGTNSPSYVLLGKKDIHHITCRKCKKSFAFSEIELIERLQQDLEKSSGYQIETHVLEFTGVCPVCRKKAT